MAGNRLAGIELGGTKCVLVLGDGVTIVERVQLPTTTPAETLAGAVAVLRGWHDAAPLAAIGIASFGPIRVDPQAADYGQILATPKPGWAGADVLGAVRAALPCPVLVDTDVNGAALAEQAHGAGRGCGTLVYLTIGTGLGGGVLVEGQPVHGRMHPEIGHLRLRRAAGDTFAGSCPFHGDCIEGLIAGPALHARLPRPPGDLPADDPAWEPVAHDLAQLVASLMLSLSPQKIVIGGGVTGRQPHLLPRARALVPGLLAGYLGPLDEAAMADLVVPPLLGDDAGPTGALVLAARALAGENA
ncbi:ROK family protein [Altererythrobacter buctensis]|uniref:fructokinase n=1 Tax=Alteraurantiacibacter buctensis TaxID=1503981 RepID=A0A844YRM8_9SPHN|nr:ROK family protein [Alteraurantiacibacter buctensis]